jgi:hypothetical protein
MLPPCNDHSANRATSAQSNEDKTSNTNLPRPVETPVEEMLSDLTLGDLCGSETDAGVIDAICSPEAEEREKMLLAREEARANFWRDLAERLRQTMADRGRIRQSEALAKRVSSASALGECNDPPLPVQSSAHNGANQVGKAVLEDLRPERSVAKEYARSGMADATDQEISRLYDDEEPIRRGTYSIGNVVYDIEAMLSKLDGDDEPTTAGTALEGGGGQIKSSNLETLRSTKVTKGLPKRRSNKITRRKRVSDAKDQEVLQIVREYKLPSSIAISSSFSSVFPPSIPVPVTDLALPFLPVWEHTGDRIKLAASTIALQAWWDHPTSWSFDLNPDAEAEALKRPKQAVRWLSRSFSRALQRHLGYIPLYWLKAEVSASGRLHLHGAIALEAKDHRLLEEIMKEAWGAWKGRGKSRQVHLNSQRCDDGWVDYVLKARAKTRAVIGDHDFYISDELRRRGEFVYGELRDLIR